MSQIIRSEFNLLNGSFTDATGATGPDPLIFTDITNFSGTSTFWFEIVHSGTAGNTGTWTLAINGGTPTSIAGETSATKVLSRAQVTPGTSPTNFIGVVNQADGTHAQTIYAARLIILQTGDPSIRFTETQIEIGDKDIGRTNTAAADLTNPKFWKYNSANWDGSKKFFVDVVWKTSAKNTCTITLCRTSDNAANVTIVSAGTSSSTYTFTRVPFTPVNGETYKIRCLSSTTKSSYSITCAKVAVIQSYAEIFVHQGQASGGQTIQGGSAAGTSTAGGQSFTAASTFDTSKIWLKLYKVGTPTADLLLEILTGSMTGTVIGTASLVAESSSVTSTDGGWVAFSFTSAVSLTNGTKYYLRLTRSPDTQTFGNYCVWRVNSGTDYYAGNGLYDRQASTWGSESTTADALFHVTNDSVTNLTKLEPQMLLLNTGDAGTGVQGMLTTYNASEWNVGTGSLTITHLIDSDNASNSAKIVTAANADTGTSSAATGLLQAESAAFSLIDATNYDTNVTNSTGTVAASRLKVVYVYVAEVVRRIFITGG